MWSNTCWQAVFAAEFPERQVNCFYRQVIALAGREEVAMFSRFRRDFRPVVHDELMEFVCCLLGYWQRSRNGF